MRLLLLSSVVVPAGLLGQADGPIRSSLQTVDIHAGHIDTVYTAERHFEAPNWSPDGRFFIVNSQGRLYRLAERGDKGLEEISTGFATRLNNDHGISPDGRHLVISHHADEHITDPQQAWLGSSIYILPIAGSPTPVKVTTKAPSFWHGWSPDGKTLAFVGRRDGEWDIYTISVEGGEERRLTTCAGLDDGPDYAPDGAFIYYNSFCSGKMEIWRMRPDGTGAEQLTRDAYSNWFPHPSPDGRWVVYLAYLEDQGEAHPFGRDVKLRLMDVRDGSVRDLTPPFFGGQGTLNVPSWSPDSRRVAFVAYERRAPEPSQADTAALVMGDLGRRLDEYLTRAEAFGFAGTVLVAKDGEIALRKGYGEADRESGRPVTPATVFTVGSITKQFTAAAIMKLEEQGRLRVSDALGRFFPDVPADKAGITLHHLLTHTAGLGGDFGGDYQVMPRDSLVGLALAAPLSSPPGARHRYTNVGYSILGAVVELASGRPYETYLREALFAPTGMLETGYRLPRWLPERFAAAYRGVERWGTTVERPWAPDGPWWNLRANGGILSTAGDLYRWHLALEDNRVLSAASRERLMTPHVPENAEGSSHYGYGWAVTPTPRGTRLVWHNGGNGFFFADFRRYVDERVVVIFLTNESVHERVERGLVRLIFGMDVAVPPAAGPAPPPERLLQLAGRYRLPSGAEFEVRAHGGRLEIEAADPEVAAAFITLPELGGDARARLSGVDTVVRPVVGGMARGDFDAFRSHFLRTGDVSVDEEVTLWTGAFEAWGRRFGAFRGFTLLGTTPGRSPAGPTLDTWVAVRFERGVRLIQFIQGAEGPPTGFYLNAASDRALPARHVLVPAGPDRFLTFDFTFERATPVRVEAAASGEPRALVIASPRGDVVAVRV